MTSDRPIVTVSAGLAVSEEALALVRADVEEAKANLEFRRAPGTLATYANEWKQFQKWAAERMVETLPASSAVLTAYIANLGTRRKPAGIAVAISAIAWKHREAGIPCEHRVPMVLDQHESVRRRRKVRPEQKAPLTVDLLRKAVDKCPGTLPGKRDRAVLLVAFAGAFRREELVSLLVSDLTFEEKGVRILLRDSKTDQMGVGLVKAIPYAEDPTYCPVLALQDLLAAMGITEGHVFRSLDRANESRRAVRPDDALSDKAVARIVKGRLEAAGIDSRKYSGHSPRAGLVTSAAREGHDVWSIMAQTGHTKVDTLAKYVREVQAFDNNANKGLL